MHYHIQSGKKKIKPDRKERNDSVYQLSRYVPYVKDIMEVCRILRKILTDQRKFQTLLRKYNMKQLFSRLQKLCFLKVLKIRKEHFSRQHNNVVRKSTHNTTIFLKTTLLKSLREDCIILLQMLVVVVYLKNATLHFSKSSNNQSSCCTGCYWRQTKHLNVPFLKSKNCRRTIICWYNFNRFVSRCPIRRQTTGCFLSLADSCDTVFFLWDSCVTEKNRPGFYSLTKSPLLRKPKTYFKSSKKATVQWQRNIKFSGGGGWEQTEKGTNFYTDHSLSTRKVM